ncbi:MAG TPA: TetR/AcrR family transcriptional regulator [Burkholderiales bacterium]|nr:TetR/AcrR family transcriptional regulator [Burkholderiales bacterium]
MVTSRKAAADGPRERIVGGARRHFFAHGFRGVTMDELARELGMSKKTLYVSFPGKRDLLHAVIDDKAAAIDADLERITSDRDAPFEERLARLLECFRTHAGEIQPSFVRDVRREAPELFERIERLRADVLERHFGKLLERGRRDGLVRKDIPVKLLIEVLLGVMSSVVNPQKVEELGTTPKVAMLSVLAVFLEGALVRKK